MIDLAALAGQTIFITGSSRGSGKTTFLNYLAERMRAFGPVGIAAIGAHEAAGPPCGSAPMGARILTQPSDLVITVFQTLSASRGLFRIIDEMGERTAHGRVVCAEVLRGAPLSMVGPRTNRQLQDLLERCAAAESGRRTFLIDGAPHRLTQVAAMASSGFIEVLKVDGVGCAAAARRLQFLSYMDACPVWNEKNAAHLARVHHVDGALTRERFAQVAGKVDAVVVEDLTKVFLDPGVLSSIPLWVRRRIPLKAVVINPWGMTRDQVQAFLERQAPQDRMMLTPFWEASG